MSVTVDGVQSVSRAVQILEALAEAPLSVPIAAVAAQVGLPASTTYRLVAVLEQAGLVQRLPGRTVGVGVKTLDLANAARRHAEERVLQTVRSTMRWLAQETHETLLLMMPAGRVSVCVDQVLCRYPIRTSYEPGGCMPLYAGAANKVILAFMEPSRRDAIVAESDGLPLPTGEHVSSERLAAQLHRIREIGYCMTEGEIDHGTTGVAFPIVHNGRVLASLTVAGPTARLRPQWHSLVPLLQRAVMEISTAWD